MLHLAQGNSQLDFSLETQSETDHRNRDWPELSHKRVCLGYIYYVQTELEKQFTLTCCFRS